MTINEIIGKYGLTGKMLVRSQDQIAVLEQDSTATGLQMTPEEALECYGEEILAAISHEGSALLTCERGEPALTFRARRVCLGWSVETLAVEAGVTSDDVVDAENSAKISPMHTLISIARAIGLDPRYISFKKGDPYRGYMY
ncbi:hypothetical protein HZB94_01290 [Candidatus Falkowbacteria bacterium]|nr:hypothetical protein [Candidatus Falkowbacteria bacterium]